MGERAGDEGFARSCCAEQDEIDRLPDPVASGDCDDLRGDPLFKLAVGRQPDGDRDRRSQASCADLSSGDGSGEADGRAVRHQARDQW